MFERVYVSAGNSRKMGCNCKTSSGNRKRKRVLIEQSQMLEELNALIKEGNEKILPTKWYPDGVFGAPYYVDRTLYAGWHTKALTFLKLFLSEETDFVQTFIMCTDNTFSRAQAAIAVLESLTEYIKKGFVAVKGADYIDLDIELHRLFNRFHRIARQLRSWHEARPTISIEDEYDVQDLLHALLKLFFDDVRPEEWTPSYAGKSARMDFLLKNEKTVIEVKKTRKGLADRELGDQLIVDVDRYKTHKPIYVGRSFTDDETGEAGTVIEVSDTEVKIEFEKEYWTNERSDFCVDRKFEDLLESIHKTLCSLEYGFSQRIFNH